VLELSPDYEFVHSYMAQSYLLLGKLSEALSEAEKEPHKLFKSLNRSMILFAAGKKSESDAELNWFLANAENWDNHSALCQVYSMRNDREKAIASVQKAYEARESSLFNLIKVEPLLDPIRSDPRFIALLKKIEGT
jgi:hypothetical protein